MTFNIFGPWRVRPHSAIRWIWIRLTSHSRAWSTPIGTVVRLWRSGWCRCRSRLCLAAFWIIWSRATSSESVWRLASWCWLIVLLFLRDLFCFFWSFISYFYLSRCVPLVVEKIKPNVFRQIQMFLVFFFFFGVNENGFLINTN